MSECTKIFLCFRKQIKQAKFLLFLVISEDMLTNVCRDDQWNSPRGYLSTPNYPMYYPMDMDCKCVLTATGKSRDKGIFGTFYLHYTTSHTVLFTEKKTSFWRRFRHWQQNDILFQRFKGLYNIFHRLPLKCRHLTQPQLPYHFFLWSIYKNICEIEKDVLYCNNKHRGSRKRLCLVKMLPKDDYLCVWLDFLFRFLVLQFKKNKW